MLKEFAISSSMLIIAILCGTVSAEKSQIGQIYPDFPDINAPKLIVGENFGDDVEVWQYSPQQEGGKVGEPLPDTPPEGSQRCNIRDRENQVIVADVSGDIVWVKNADGFSKPYLINIAKPYWISDEKVKQGDVVHIYGFGLRFRILLWQIILCLSQMRE
jgi:hypothetical protein